MNKNEAAEIMIEKIKKIEKERVADLINANNTNQRKEVVQEIISNLEALELDDEN